MPTCTARRGWPATVIANVTRHVGWDGALMRGGRRPDFRQDAVSHSIGRWIFDSLPCLMRSMQPVGSAPTGFFTWPWLWAKRALLSTTWCIDFCRLFLSLGPSIPRGNLPLASLPSGRRTYMCSSCERALAIYRSDRRQTALKKGLDMCRNISHGFVLVNRHG